jgi:eukaryotic-like serine/threonine-protein kinase
MPQKRQAVRRSETTVGAVLLLLLSACPPAFAQCPDGTPPPCGPARAPDTSRIAVFPFRVTTADVQLGEGLAELIADELSSERAWPRAAHMAGVIRAWQRARGGPRTPLERAQAARAARTLDAGWFTEGAIVGLGGQRVRVTLAVVSTANGTVRRATPVTGPIDSLDGIARRVTVNLLAAAFREARLTERSTLTESPAAMLHYLRGLALFRRAHIAEAGQAFERALAADSSFARAAFMRLAVALWGAPGPDTGDWQARAWHLRDRLGGPDRMVLGVMLGVDYPRPSDPRRQLAALEDVARRLPESAEAHYELADFLYHRGAAADVEASLARAVVHFRRAIALDSQQAVVGHLALNLMFLGDTAAVRRLLPELDRTDSTVWATRWTIAAWLGDSVRLARLRRQNRGGGSPTALVEGAIHGVAAPLVAEGIDLMDARLRSGGTTWPPAVLRFVAAVIQGRPSAARHAIEGLPEIMRAGLMLVADLLGVGDAREAELAAVRLEAAPDSALTASARCRLILWSLSRGRGQSQLEQLAPDTECALLARAVVAAQRNDPAALGALERADSAVRMATAPTHLGCVVLSELWERRDPRRALAASRLADRANYWTDASDAYCARQEGRLAALVGDTAAARVAYHRYLVMRREAEPAMIPQRDSVAAALARLERR